MATMSKGCCSLLPAALLWLLLIEPARSAEYVVNDWKLGANVTSGSLQSQPRVRTAQILHAQSRQPHRRADARWRRLLAGNRRYAQLERATVPDQKL
jgi:hypothetical protein